MDLQALKNVAMLFLTQVYRKRRRKKWYWLEEVRLECYGRMRSPEPSRGGFMGDEDEEVGG